MSTSKIPFFVLEVLSIDDDYDADGNLSEDTITKLAAQAEARLSADDMQVIGDFEERFMTAMHSLAQPSDYVFGQLTGQARERLFDEAWKRAQPEAYEELMNRCKVRRLIDEAAAAGIIEFDDSRTKFRLRPESDEVQNFLHRMARK